MTLCDSHPLPFFKKIFSGTSDPQTFQSELCNFIRQTALFRGKSVNQAWKYSFFNMEMKKTRVKSMSNAPLFYDNETKSINNALFSYDNGIKSMNNASFSYDNGIKSMNNAPFSYDNGIKSMNNAPFSYDIRAKSIENAAPLAGVLCQEQ